MVLTGKQKAALLLMSLDAATAAELLKGVDSETIQELAVEAAYLDVSGYRTPVQSTHVARQFCLCLEQHQEFRLKDFLDVMLKSTVGPEKAEQIQNQIQELLQRRDPFIPIRQADPKTLAAVLDREHPQAVAVVLAELPARKSSEILGLLSEKLRLDVVTKMAGGQPVTAEAKARIAQLVCSQLETPDAQTAADGQDQTMRKVAVMLRNLDREIRDGLLNNITQKDEQVGNRVVELMVIWEDILEVTDRSLQQALREIDAQKLALALMNAEDAVVAKIKSNISERAVAAIEEETSLMSSPSKADIEEARNTVVSMLRELNDKGELAFIEE